MSAEQSDFVGGQTIEQTQAGRDPAAPVFA